jgi:hypothetical protein
VDTQRFDALTKALSAAGSRRVAAAGLFGALGLLGRLGDESAEAHNNWARCKKIPDKKKRKKCVKKGKAHKKWHETNACRGEGQICGTRPCCKSLACNAEGRCAPATG